MKTQIKRLFLGFLIACFSVSAFSQQTVEKYAIELEYLQYLPEGYEDDDTTLWPVLIFLHGVGEVGTDIEMIKIHGLPKLIEAGKQFPFIVLSPQARSRGWNPEDLHIMMETAFKYLRVDPERIYLTGLSMGGFGTWATAIAYPDLFAAIIPICGGGDPAEAEKLKDMPVWCFHGDNDTVVPMALSENMVNALKEYNPEVKFTVYPGVGHDSWTTTYENEAIYNWLLQHKRKK